MRTKPMNPRLWGGGEMGPRFLGGGGKPIGILPKYVDSIKTLHRICF